MPDDIEQDEASSPSTRKITIGGKEFEVPEEVAVAAQVERDRLANDYGSRLQALQNYEANVRAREEQILAAQQPAYESNEPRPPDPKDLELNPEKYARENVAYTQYLVEARAEQSEEQRRAEQQAMAAETARAAKWTQWVTGFYKTHSDLVGDEDIVDAVWRQNFGAIRNMDAQNGEAATFLAQKSRERILKIAERGKTRRAPRIEAAGGSPNFQQPVEEEEPSSFGLGKYIKAKNARMRAAAK